MAGAFATLVYRILVLHTMQGGSRLHFTDQEHSVCYGKAAVAVNWVRRAGSQPPMNRWKRSKAARTSSGICTSFSSEVEHGYHLVPNFATPSNASTTSVSAPETSSEPKQPSLLEKRETSPVLVA